MRGTGADQLVVVMMQLKDCGAKGLSYSVGLAGQPLRGGACDVDKAF